MSISNVMHDSDSKAKVRRMGFSVIERLVSIWYHNQGLQGLYESMSAAILFGGPVKRSKNVVEVTFCLERGADYGDD